MSSVDPDAAGTDGIFTLQTPSKNYGCFYSEWVRNNFKSEAEGKEIGETQDFVLIISPGQSKTEVRQKVKEQHKKEFPEEWKAYREGREQMSSGIPIAMLPGLEKGRAASLRALYIMTIEQLAECSDMGLQKVGMGGNELRDMAKKYLNGAQSSAKALAEANVKIAELTARLEVLEVPKESAKPKHRGWPKGKPRKTI